MGTESNNPSNGLSRIQERKANRIVAVIDIGTTSVRMAIAQINADYSVRNLDSLTQAVNLGRDTFTRGEISQFSTEACVDALLDFKRVLREYDIETPERIFAVGTNAVREATNRQTFLDRIYIATGIDIKVIEESEATRFTYLGVQPILQRDKQLSDKRVMVMEAGGGSTEVLALQSEHVLFTDTCRLGTLRIRQMLETFRAPTNRKGELMAAQIENTVNQIVQTQQDHTTKKLLLLGGDIRFAAQQLIPDWRGERIVTLQTKDLEDLTRTILELSVDELVLRYHLQYPDAETLGPALLIYSKLAKSIHAKKIYVGNASLRDGLLYEVAHEGAWSEEFLGQIRESVWQVGTKFSFDSAHAQHVSKLALQIFDDLQSYHQLKGEYRVILQIAALLHEIGLFISNRNHHKHSMYLIQASEIFGMSSRQKMIAALTARYYRQSPPKPTHKEYEALKRRDRIRVSKMAALLRVADALDTSHSQRINTVEIERTSDRIIINIPGETDISLEQLALRRKGPLFQQVYGKDVLLRTKSNED